MKNLDRWIIQHNGAARTIAFGIVFLLDFLLVIPLDIPLILGYLLVLVMLYPLLNYINSAPLRLLRDPHRRMVEDCDPTDYRDMTQWMSPYTKPSLQGQVLQINQAAALGQLGEHKEAVEILEDLNIDKFPVTADCRYIYYHNLASELMLVGRDFEADIWSKKALAIYRDMPAGKRKQGLAHNAETLEIDVLYRQRDYVTALQKLAWLRCDNQNQLLHAAITAAKCHLALEEWAKARTKLEYVIANGNKLGIVKEAQDLLPKCDAHE